MSFAPGQVRVEPVRDEDVKKVAEGVYTVDYRFTILPERLKQAPITLAVCAKWYDELQSTPW